MGKGKRQKEEPDQVAGEPGHLPPQQGKEVRVPYHDKPPAPPPGQKIHPRKTIPPLRKGKDVPDDTPSPPVEPE